MDKENKKQLISDTYMKLLSEKPDGRISVTMLISACGLSRQTFYYHFRDILDVVEYTFRSMMNDILIESSDSEDPKEGIRSFIDLVDKNRGMIKKLQDTNRSREIQKCVADTIAEISEDIIESRSDSGERHNINEMRFALAMYANGFEGYVLDKIDNNEPLDADALSDLLYRFITGELNMLSV